SRCPGKRVSLFRKIDLNLPEKRSQCSGKTILPFRRVDPKVPKKESQGRGARLPPPIFGISGQNPPHYDRRAPERYQPLYTANIVGQQRAEKRTAGRCGNGRSRR